MSALADPLYRLVGDPVETEVGANIAGLRLRFADFEIKKPDPMVHRELAHGWLLPYLLDLDRMMWRRWEHSFEVNLTGGLELDGRIPPCEFLGFPHARTRKMLEASLDSITTYGSWTGWSSSEHLRFFLDWLLYGFGDRSVKELPKPPAGCEGASDRLYQVFNLGPMMLWPYDYFGDILAENAYGKGQGFFPTPINVVHMMVQMLMGDGDLRAKTVHDPCVGTGRFPLLASNYSYRLSGQDVDGLMVKATLVNGYFYAPWLVRPFQFWESWPPYPEDDETCDPTAPASIDRGLAVIEETPALSNWRLTPVQVRSKNSHLQRTLF